MNLKTKSTTLAHFSLVSLNFDQEKFVKKNPIIYRAIQVQFTCSFLCKKKNVLIVTYTDLLFFIRSCVPSLVFAVKGAKLISYHNTTQHYTTRALRTPNYLINNNPF